jgi:hypothetical protein
VWGSIWIEIHWNSIWLRTRSHVTSHYTWGSMATLATWCWRGLTLNPKPWLGTTFGHFLLGSHNCMVTALGLCVKWPWVRKLHAVCCIIVRTIWQLCVAIHIIHGALLGILRLQQSVVPTLCPWLHLEVYQQVVCCVRLLTINRWVIYATKT